MHRRISGGFFRLYSLLRENFGAATGGMFSFFSGPESRRDAEEGDGREGKVGRHSAPRQWTAPTVEGLLISLQQRSGRNCSFLRSFNGLFIIMLTYVVNINTTFCLTFKCACGMAAAWTMLQWQMLKTKPARGTSYKVISL